MNKQQFSWALYDWANSAFATVVIAGFFPIFFRDYWAGDLPSAEITWQLGWANGLASLFIVLLAPVVGTLADRGGWKKPLLMGFAFSGMAATLALFWVVQGNYSVAVILYVLATLGFMAANVFYDSLIVDVAEAKDFDRLSAIAYSLGYLGGGLLFAFCVVMTLNPGWFGFDGAAVAVRISFVLVALWWLMFSIPLMIYVKQKPCFNEQGVYQIVIGSYQQLKQTIIHVSQLRVVWLFLLAYWLYIDGVDTIIRMAVDFGRAIGFEADDLIAALLIVQFVGFPAAWAYGYYGEKFGAKKALLFGVFAYAVFTVFGSMMREAWHFYALAVAIGLVQGGIQALSRSVYARIIPQNKAGEFFGFYNMIGKSAAVIGPIMIGWVSVLTNNPRLSLLSILVLFVLGGFLLYRLNLVDQEGRRIS